MLKSDLLLKIPFCSGWRDLPEPVQQAIRIVDSPPEQADTERLAALIHQTPDLEKVVLRHMNSPFYAPVQRVTDVREAVTQLGFEAMRNYLVNYMTHFILHGKVPHRPAFDLHEYWRHAVATSLAADMLGQKLGFDDSYRIFTYGLLHDIGFVVLEACFGEKVDEIYQKIRDGVPQIVAEKAVLGGITHSDVGAWLCARWGLDEEAARIVRYHHTPLLAEGQSSELLLIYLGNLLGTRVYEDDMEIEMGADPVEDRILKQLGLDRQDMHQVDALLDEEVEHFFQQRIV